MGEERRGEERRGERGGGRTVGMSHFHRHVSPVEPRAVHLRDAARGEGLATKVLEHFVNGLAQLCLNLSLGECPGVLGGVGLKRSEGRAELRREHVRPRRCPLAPFYKRRA